MNVSITKSARSALTQLNQTAAVATAQNCARTIVTCGNPFVQVALYATPLEAAFYLIHPNTLTPNPAERSTRQWHFQSDGKTFLYSSFWNSKHSHQLMCKAQSGLPRDQACKGRHILSRCLQAPVVDGDASAASRMCAIPPSSIEPQPR